MMDSIRSLVRGIKNKSYKDADDLYRKRTRFGELNEFWKRLVVASDRFHYSPPFMGNPMRSGEEKSKWQDGDGLTYEYQDEERRAVAMRRFEFMLGMVEKRISKQDRILDVGCNTGFFLEQFYQRGYKNVIGLDPMKMALDWAKKNRPHIQIQEGFFGPPSSDIPCDLMVFFGSIFRVPYGDRLFDAIDRSAKKYVLMWIHESLDDFHRDVHVGLAKKGFICIEKQVVTDDYIPIGHEGARGPMLVLNDDVDINYNSFLLFRRVGVEG